MNSEPEWWNFQTVGLSEPCIPFESSIIKVNVQKKISNKKFDFGVKSGHFETWWHFPQILRNSKQVHIQVCILVLWKVIPQVTVQLCCFLHIFQSNSAKWNFFAQVTVLVGGHCKTGEVDVTHVTDDHKSFSQRFVNNARRVLL